MKILSYNLYGSKNTKYPIPIWEERQKNLDINLSNILKDEDIKVLCFQEVNENNIDLVQKICINNNFVILEKYAMRTRTILQYNIIAIKNYIKVENITCIPHGTDDTYANVNKQIIDYGMSDYRTTVFVEFNYNNQKYIIGNVHTDHLSPEGRIKGLNKSLKFLNYTKSDYKIIVGDMNMELDCDEVSEILKNNSEYVILRQNSDYNTKYSYHGYNQNGPYNVDFAIIENNKKECYDYKIIEQEDMMKEGSDHRPIIIAIIK